MDTLPSGDIGWNSDISFERKNVSIGSIGDRLPIPVTISNLLACLDDLEDAVVFGNYSFLTIQTIGKVIKAVDESTEVSYVLQDRDNPEKKLEVIRFDSGEHQHNEFVDDMIIAGTCVKLIGKLKKFDNMTKVLAYMIHEIEDDKDYRIFELEAKVAKMFFEKNVIERMRANQMKNASGMLAPPWTSSYIEHPPTTSPDKPILKRTRIPENTKVVAPVSIPEVKPKVAKTGAYKNYTGMKAKVYGYIRSKVQPRGEFPSSTGVPFDVIYNKLKLDNLSVKAVQAILEDLVNDSSIFESAIDHYAIIDD